MTTKNMTPPSNSQRIYRVAQLPQERSPATYVVANEGESPTSHMLQKRNRQIMDLLIQGPVYSASPIRISDIVHILKREIGLEVETKIYPSDPIVGSGAFGVYFLKSHVHRLEEQQVAA